MGTVISLYKDTIYSVKNIPGTGIISLFYEFMSMCDCMSILLSNSIRVTYTVVIDWQQCGEVLRSTGRSIMSAVMAVVYSLAKVDR